MVKVRAKANRARIISAFCDWCGVEREHETTCGSDANTDPVQLLAEHYNWVTAGMPPRRFHFCSRRCRYSFIKASEDPQ